MKDLEKAFEILHSDLSQEEITELLTEMGFGTEIEQANKMQAHRKMAIQTLYNAEKDLSEADREILTLINNKLSEDMKSETVGAIVSIFIALNSKIVKLETNVRNLSSLIADKL